MKERDTETILTKTLELQASKEKGLIRIRLADRKNTLHQTEGKKTACSQLVKGQYEEPDMVEKVRCGMPLALLGDKNSCRLQQQRPGYGAVLY